VTAILDAPTDTEVEAPAETQLLTDLRELRQLLEDPARWTQFTAARNANGARANPLSPVAVRWCLVGAIQRIASCVGTRRSQLHRALQNAASERWGVAVPVSHFNDSARHHELLDVIDLAIRREEQNA
jgi:hypothetical protein